MFKDSGKILAGKVGYMGPAGSQQEPTYEDVCTGHSGHIEVYSFEYEGNAETYRNLIRHFFMFHDPTTMNRQGNDRGTQYSSAIICYDEEQVAYLALLMLILNEYNVVLCLFPYFVFLPLFLAQIAIANSVKSELQQIIDSGKIATGYREHTVTTQILPSWNASPFYPAEDYHQQYLAINPGGYCNHKYRCSKFVDKIIQ